MNLPIESHEKELEEISIVHLQNLLLKEFENKYKFKFSKGRCYDYGVDCNFELRINRGMTNINCHVQVKAIDKLEKKAKRKNGSYSIQIKTSNVHYLMNTPKSLYILFVNSENQFYYEWADDFFLKLRKEDEGWDSKPGKKTLNFKNKIDDNALLLIFNKVWERAKLDRRISEELSLYTYSNLPKSSNIIVDANNHNVESENEIIEFIEKYGLSQEKGFLILKKAELLTKKVEEFPLACLILSFSYYKIGHIYNALHYITKANLSKDSLEKKYRTKVDVLKVGIKYSLGLLTNEQFNNSAQKISSEWHQLLLHLVKIKKDFNPDSIKGIEEIRNFANKMKPLSEVYPTIYIRSKIHLLYAEHNFYKYHKLRNTRNEEQLTKLLKKCRQLHSELDKELIDFGEGFLFAMFFQIYVQIQIDHYVMNFKKDNEDFEDLNELIDISVEFYKKSNLNRNLCISLIIQLRLFKYYGKENEVQKNLKEILQIAEIYDFRDLIDKVNNINKFNYK